MHSGQTGQTGQRGICWLDGSIQPLERARIPVLDHGLLYGDGIFEGVRFHFGKPFLLAGHLQRLRLSARAIALGVPWSDRELAAIVARVIEAFGEPQGYLRLVVTRGDGPLGIDPGPCRRPRLIVVAGQLSLVDAAARAAGIRVVIASTRRLPPDGLDPRIKSLNYLNHVLARIEASQAGADEAILLNAQGRVAEGSADNVFVVRDGHLLTPPVTDGALAGITRGLVLELARGAGIGAREESLAPYDLYTADECFLTGTGAELIPVAEIDGRRPGQCPGPVYRRLEQAFRAHVRRYCEGILT